MSRLLIRGGNRLQGEVTIQGAKNSVLPILAATILTGGSVELRRCPRLRDVEASIRKPWAARPGGGGMCWRWTPPECPAATFPTR